MIPGLDGYGSSSEDDQVVKVEKTPPKKKRRRFTDTEKFEIVSFCINDCKGNAAEAVRSPAFKAKCFSSRRVTQWMKEAFANVGLSLKLDGSQDHLMKFQGQSPGKPESIII